MPDMLPGQVAYGGILWLRHLWAAWKKHKVGIYGVWGTGKTTLNRQISTSGELEIDELEEAKTSTHHSYSQKKKKYILPPPSTKRVRLNASETIVASRTLSATDLGGHEEYFELWLEDMITRRVEIVIWLIDHRHLQHPEDNSQRDAFKKFVDVLISGNYPFKNRKLRKMARGYKPKLLAVVANKADIWLDDSWTTGAQKKQIGQHPIFVPFTQDLVRLQRNLMIPTLKRSISALRNWNVERVIWDLLQAKP
mgnify:FL=1|jgi:signal recognition particle receptor subunit beta